MAQIDMNTFFSCPLQRFMLMVNFYFRYEYTSLVIFSLGFFLLWIFGNTEAVLLNNILCRHNQLL